MASHSTDTAATMSVESTAAKDVSAHVTPPQQSSNTVAELQATLAQTKQELAVKEAALKQSTTNSTCSFLEKLPLEVRNQIYGLLLINDSLSTCYGLWCGYPKYRLSPQILRTCRQIRDESSLVLYGDNTFMAYCIGDHGEVCTPLNQKKTMDSRTAIQAAPAVMKVRHWKVVISAAVRSESQIPNASVVSFCQEISRSSPRSLEVLLARKGSEFESIQGKKRLIKDHYDIEAVMSPFKILRNVGKFIVSQGSVHDELISFELYDEYDTSDSDSDDQTDDWFDLGFVTTSLKTLVEGDTLCDRVFLMQQKLVEYAQTFERYPSFKSDMRVMVGEAARLQNDRLEALHRIPRGNPFKQNPPHIVEQGLELSCYASDENDVKSFQSQRKIVLEYLEPQYQRIAEAGRSLTMRLTTNSSRFVKAGNSGNNLLRQVDFAEAYLLLQDYANAFHRDMPRGTQSHVRTMQSLFDSKYVSTVREVVMKQLAAILEQSNWKDSYVDFESLALLAFKAMRDQHTIVHHSRMSLFDNDLESTCDIDIKSFKDSNKLVWGMDGTTRNSGTSSK